jgi:hypothetical protein
VILMKFAVLHDAGISFTPWGIAAVKALVLAKFMLLGRAMKIRERFHDRPLIWPTLHKSFAFLVLLIVLTVIEEVVVGLFHHQSVAASLGERTGAKLYETLAGYIIMLLGLIPYIAWGVLDEALGEGRLARMFFCRSGVGYFVTRRLYGPTEPFLNQQRGGNLCPRILSCRRAHPAK